MTKLSPIVRNVSSENESAQPTKILNSWKEIASYIGRGVRTVQRYELQFGFPIHRRSSTRGSVLAFADEVEAWLHEAPVRSASTPTKVIEMPANTSKGLNSGGDCLACPFCNGTGRASAEVVSGPKRAVNSSAVLSHDGRFVDHADNNRGQSPSN